MEPNLTMSLTKYIALVSETKRVTPSDLNKAAAALDKQVKRDFGGPWGVNASVSAFAKLEDVPTDYWPVVIKDTIPYPAQGIHLDHDGQPFALVAWSSEWALTSSHESLEMLADPFGNRLVAGKSPKPGQGRVNFLVEVCDPSEAPQFGYTVNGILLSDFYLPSFFEPVKATGVRYSYTDAIKQPRQILRGGYISWEVPQTREWWQQTWFNGTKPTFRSLGIFDAAKFSSLRAFIDHNTLEPLKQQETASKTFAVAAAGLSLVETVDTAAVGRAGFLNKQISALLKI
jgi:hypothetical protein